MLLQILQGSIAILGYRTGICKLMSLSVCLVLEINIKVERKGFQLVHQLEPDITELKIQEQRNIITTLPLSYKDVHISIGKSLEVYEHKK